MLQSNFLSKTLRKNPKDSVAISHQFLVRGGYIQQLTSGIWSLLPLGFRVYQKIENIIREEMTAVGGEELRMPALQPKEIWTASGRWNSIDPPLFKFKDRHKKELALGSTHEEVITKIAGSFIDSYKDLPKYVFQIQNKFRNELRPTAGLLRTREFVMKDMYSFHATNQDLDAYYLKVAQSYKKLYSRCGLEAMMVNASSGTIGGDSSNEFIVAADSGEDNIFLCPDCGWATNSEVGGSLSVCPQCQAKLIAKKGIEVGHIFKLGDTYSQKMKALFMDERGNKKPIIAGCYGIGLERLMATVIEVNHDSKGIIWPQEIAPFQVHLLGLDLEDEKVLSRAQEIYQKLKSINIEVLFDDRKETAGVKFKDADLIGIPWRLVVSKKTGDKIEVKERREGKEELFTENQLLDKVKAIF
ncbi:proline--tRNA ligase [Patescibacteria group bacterium]|nr:proline--tRNA ligase [Patescibacteria group bacterium]